MKTFITDNFLLKNKTAQTLYHEYSKDMPIVDYHCHLPADEIAIDKHYRSITEMWLDKDHYKWRAIRTAGFTEEDITANISNIDYDKKRFDVWAKVLPDTIGNPLYHWTNLELLRYFDIDDLLTTETADSIYEVANNAIARDDFSTKNLIKKFNLKYIGTTDDPVDSLEHHKKIMDDKFECRVAPSWRPDKIININLDTFKDYMKTLSQSSNVEIKDISTLMKAIDIRIEHFKRHGCSISDHALDNFVFIKNIDAETANTILKKAFAGNSLTEKEVAEYKSYILLELGKLYSKNNWVMQLHINALRNNNTKMFQRIGADAGFDCINDVRYASSLSGFLDSLEVIDSLPKTILYSLNPNDNEMLGAMLGNFQGNSPSKLQLGSGWWFNDTKDGMERQMITLANLGLLSKFVGMLTDSRSFLSFSRHEYFRRILCNIIGTWVEDGEITSDIKYLGKIVQDISYNNAVNYFDLSK